MTSNAQIHMTSAGGGNDRWSDDSHNAPEKAVHTERDGDSSTEQESSAAHPMTSVHLSTTVSRPENVVGFSMSPRTSTDEGSKRIWSSDDYPHDTEIMSGKGHDSINHDAGQIPNTKRSGSAADAGRAGTKMTAAQPSEPQNQQRRSEGSRLVLKDGFQPSRRRATSGPGAVADNIKRLLPDLSSLLSFKSPPSIASSSHSSRQSDDEERKPRASSSRPSWIQSRSGSIFQPSPLRNDISSGTRGQNSSSGQRSQPLSSQALGFNGTTSSVPAPPPQEDKLLPLRRSTSENSLFLRRNRSAAAGRDDPNRWDYIGELSNNYLIAMTNVFQDSRFRLPKLPTTRPPVSRPGSSDKFKGDEIRPTITKPPDWESERHFYAPMEISENVDSQRALPLISEATSKVTGDIVVLGGYRGSILRSAKPPHRQLWIPVKVGLNIRKVDLEVGLYDEDEETMEDRIIPSGTLSHIGPFDICRRLLRHLWKSPNSRTGHLRVHDYGYDWRLSPDLLSRKLIASLEKLECNQPTTLKRSRGAIVIAHSLGGLITRHAVNQRPELFSGVIYAGSPQNCVNILGPLRNGDDVMLSSRVLTAQVNFTLRTSFALLPEDGKCFIDKVTGERYDVDFFDVKTWDEYRLSPCINPPLPPYGPREPRKTLIGSLTDTIPSIPKRSSWFSSRESSPSRGANGVQDSESGTLASAKAGIRPENDISHSLEPKMSSSGTSRDNGHVQVRNTSAPIATACTIPLNDATEYLTRTLARVLAFKRALAHKPALESAYPPIAIIFGKNTPTIYGAKVASREAIKHSDAYDDLAYAAGDGVVLASAAQLPKGYQCVPGGWVESDRGHVNLLGDLEGVGRCLAALWDARQMGVGL